MSTTQTPPPTPVERPTCSCGHDRYHHAVRPDFTHGMLAWLAFFTGVSATPKAIRFRCSQCGEEFEQTTDRNVLSAFRRYPDISIDRP